MAEARTHNLRKRRARDRAFARAGFAAVAFGIGGIGFLFVALIVRAAPAATTTEIQLEVFADPALISVEAPRRGPWREILADAIFERATETERAAPGARALYASLLSEGAVQLVRNRAAAEPGLVGTRFSLYVPLADPLDQYRKGLLAAGAEASALLSPERAAAFDALDAAGHIETRLALGLFFNADSRFPELAGLAGAARGSLLALLVCFLISFPIGVAAAIWFEEFAPRSRLTDLLRVNVYNLAAVPSILFGLLGLAIFLNTLGLPRSSPLVGGLVLALMTLPTTIVVASSALRAVPDALREAALALGASRQEATFHHVLPSAMPGVLTGTMIGLARALGETAPLLLIGMNAFLPAAAGGLTDPATVLPAQIFIWADQPERGFAARTAAAILSLLVVLVAINLGAVLLRAWFEKRGRSA